ncbi:glycosyltransferase [Paenibacillus lentus]|uniref:glycosyltransferase n=1 Tax=Paenibacillus lentus TaxID=1338368 RepID=UPI0036463F54
MNVAIDTLAILGPGSKNRGIGNYTTNQLKKLFEIDKENKYFLLNFYEEIQLRDLLDYDGNVSEHYFNLGINDFLAKDSKYGYIVGEIIKKFIIDNKIDVFYITSPFDGSIRYQLDWLKGTTVVATVYDIIPYLFKEKYLSEKVTYKEYMYNLNNVIQVDKMLAISESVKHDVINQLKVNESKIDVIFAGVDESFEEKEYSPSEYQEVKDAYEIDDAFILCTGGDDERKNIGELIIAFAKLPKYMIEKYQLVVACKLSKHSESHYKDLARKHKIADRVVLTNFVPHDHLIKLYNLAYAFAFPSKYEGFGLPVIEAMACGTPVLTSNNSSLGEIAQGAAILVNPFDISDITRGLIELLEKDDLDELVRKGFDKVEKFTWEKVAINTLEAFKSLIQIDKVTGNKSEVIRNKIAFFTPLPPLESGISDYSVDILNELSSYFDIDVYIDNSYDANCSLMENINVLKHPLFLEKSEDYLDIIYQVGNSQYHSYMLKYIREYPGTIVLHDYNLHGLLHLESTKQGELNVYKEFLYEDYGSEIIDSYIDDLKKGRTNIKEFDLPTNGAVTNYAKKIIVHSDYAKRLLLEKNIGRTVKKILLYSKSEEIKNNSNLRADLNIPNDAIVISAFGHIHETKRIVPIIKAFNLLQKKYENVRLYLVGKPSPSITQELEDLIINNDLEDKVVVTGFTELSVFEDYIDASDICINLRYPYNGETSASLMRILGKGKCSLVSDLGSFSELPDDCCIKLRCAEGLSEYQEVQDIFVNLSQLIDNPRLFSSISENARKYAKENLNLTSISKQYRDYILKSVNNTISETVIKNLSDILRDYNKDELYKLSLTLAYLIKN